MKERVSVCVSLRITRGRCWLSTRPCPKNVRGRVQRGGYRPDPSRSLACREPDGAHHRPKHLHGVPRMPTAFGQKGASVAMTTTPAAGSGQARQTRHADKQARPFLYNSSAQTCSSAPDPPLHSMANAAPRRRPTSEPKPMHRVPVHSSCSAAAARTMKRRLVRDRSLYGHEGVQRPQRRNDGNNAQWQVGVGRCQIRTLLSTTDPVRALTCEHATWRSDRSSKVRAPTWGRL